MRDRRRRRAAAVRRDPAPRARRRAAGRARDRLRRAAVLLPEHLPGGARLGRGAQPGGHADRAVRHHRPRGARAHRLRPGDGLPLRRGLQRRGRRRGQARRTSTRSSACTTRPPTSRPRRGRCTRRTGCGSSPTSTTRRRRWCRPSTRQTGRRWTSPTPRCAASRPSTSSTCRTWACTPRCRSRCCATGGCGGSSPATTTPVRTCRRTAPRAAAEFLGSTLSLRLVDRFEDDQLHKRLAAQAVLAKLTAATLDDGEPLAAALLGAPDLLDLVPADGVVVDIEGERRARGSVPPPEVVAAVAAWARGGGDEIAQHRVPVTRRCPDSTSTRSVGRGRARAQPARRAVRRLVPREVLHSVDWGGDPHNKAIAVSEGDEVRLSPRKSFERWREIVRDRSEPWTPTETESAEALRRHLVESLYRRTRGALRVAETLQRSLLPESIPTLDGLAAVRALRAGRGRPGRRRLVRRIRAARRPVRRADRRRRRARHHRGGHDGAAAQRPSRASVRRRRTGRGAEPAQRLRRAHDARRVRHRASSRGSTSARAGWRPPRRPPDAVPDELGVDCRTAAPIRLSPPIGVSGVTYAPSTFTIEPGHGSGHVLRRSGRTARRGDRRRSRPVGRDSRPCRRSVTASWIWTAMAVRAHRRRRHHRHAAPPLTASAGHAPHHGVATTRPAAHDGSKVTCGRPVRGCGPTAAATSQTSAMSSAVSTDSGGPAHTWTPSRSTTISSQ